MKPPSTTSSAPRSLLLATCLVAAGAAVASAGQQSHSAPAGEPAALASPLWASLAAADSSAGQTKILSAALTAPSANQGDVDAVALMVRAAADPTLAASERTRLEALGFRTQADLLIRLSQDGQARESFLGALAAIRPGLSAAGSAASFADLQASLDRMFENAKSVNGAADANANGPDRPSAGKIVLPLESPRGHFLANFLEYSPESIGNALENLYPELRWLTKKVEISPEDAKAAPHPKSHSMRMFSEFHPEVERTVTSIVVLQQILAGDYAAFAASQPQPVKLKPESFRELREIFLNVLARPATTPSLDKTGGQAIGMIDLEKLDALIAYMAIHDLGKSKSFANVVEKLTLKLDPDHDRILILGLSEEPMLSLTFDRMKPAFKSMIMSGMLADFNMGQFAQAENVPGSMAKLASLDASSFEFYFAHLLLDVAGAGGVKDPLSAKVMIEPVYRGFSLGHQHLPHLFKGRSADDVYDDFLRGMAERLALPMTNPAERALVRIALLSRATSPEAARQAMGVYESLPDNARRILVKELNVNGTRDAQAVLLYYLPALIVNARQGTKDSDEGLRIALLTAARVFIQLRAGRLKGIADPGVFTANIKPLADLALERPRELLDVSLELLSKGDGADVTPAPRSRVDASRLARMASLSEIPGASVGLVGIGGGSDVIQAAQLGRLLKRAGKKIPFVISVRTARSASQGRTGQIGEDRTIQDPEAAIAKGVYKVGSNSSGSGRFLENLPAAEVPVYLVIDHQDGTLQDRIRAAIQHAGGAETLVALDTGGDALYSSGITDSAKATPDQDLRVLKSLSTIAGMRLMTAEIAVGVDSPADSQRVLESAQAKYYALSSVEAQSVLDAYGNWRMDGSDDQRFGKTALAWQAALRQEVGLQALPLPPRVVTDPSNPWNPFVHVDASMQGVFFMTLERHLEAIASGMPKESAP